MNLDLFDIILILVFFALFGGVFLRVGGYLVYGLIILVALIFLSRILGITI